MCYTGECKFEYGWTPNGGGGCMISDYQKFREKYGEHACVVGGVPDCYETEKYIEDNKERLDAIYEQWCKDTPWY